MAMYVGKHERARRRLLKSGGTIAFVAQTTDFCKTFSWREVYTNSLIALGTGPENSGNSYHLCLWHNPSVLVEGSGSLCLEIKKVIRELDATNPCSLFKNAHPGRPTQATKLSLPTANYLEVSGERKKCDKPRWVQNSLHIYLSKIYSYKNLQLYLGFISPMPVLG